MWIHRVKCELVHSMKIINNEYFEAESLTHIIIIRKHVENR